MLLQGNHGDKRESAKLADAFSGVPFPGHSFLIRSLSYSFAQVPGEVA